MPRTFTPSDYHPSFLLILDSYRAILSRHGGRPAGGDKSLPSAVGLCYSFLYPHSLDKALVSVLVYHDEKGEYTQQVFTETGTLQWKWGSRVSLLPWFLGGMREEMRMAHVGILRVRREKGLEKMELDTDEDETDGVGIPRGRTLMINTTAEQGGPEHELDPLSEIDQRAD
jgi:hypothetical protein